jgi:hypothetical protein
MLHCQIKTENKNIVICKKLSKKTGYDKLEVVKSYCNICQESKNREKLFSEIEKIFHIKVLLQKQLESCLEYAKEYILNNISDMQLYYSIENTLFYSLCKVLANEEQQEQNNYFLENIKSLNIETFNKLVKKEESAYKYFKNRILTDIKKDQNNTEKSIKQSIEIMIYRNDLVKRLVKEEKDKFSDSFLKDIEKSFKEQDNNIKKIREDSSFIPVPKISIFDKIKGAKEAFKRVKEQTKKEGKKTLWVDEKETIERQVCCTTCTDGGNCPYCGCQIKKSWFLPLGKSELTTEGCPNSNTYPHLKTFPPKNYWEVCNEKTSVIICARNEKYLNRTIQSLIKNSTGEIEILVGIDGCDYDVMNDNIITVLKYNRHMGRRYTSNQLVKLSTGKYLFEIDAHCNVSYGWDTKLKCVCDEKTIVGCAVDSINEESWERNGNLWIGGKINQEIRWEWDKIDPEEYEKIEESNSFNSCGWMIKRDYFDLLNGHDEDLGEWGGENIEWTLKNKMNRGNIKIRTDVVVSHLFRPEYPYEIKGLSHDDLVIKLKEKYMNESVKNVI